MRIVSVFAGIAGLFAAAVSCSNPDDPIVGNERLVISVAISPRGGDVRVGEILNLGAAVTVRGNLARSVAFSSSDPSVATVSTNDGLTGRVVGVGPGSVRITAVSTADGTKSDVVAVNVRSGVTSVSVLPDTVFTRAGQTRQLSIAVVTEPGTSDQVDLVSLNPQVVTVDASRRVTGVSLGQSYVRVVSRADVTKRDSSLVIVDPCQDVTALAIGAPSNASVGPNSCRGVEEIFRYEVAAPSMLSVSVDLSFAANFHFFGDASGRWRATNNAAGRVSALVLAAEGAYQVRIEALSASQRGPFTVTVQASSMSATTCVVGVTTGLRYTGAPLNDCGFTPQQRSGSPYRSLRYLLLPRLAFNDTVRVAVSGNGIVPLVESWFEIGTGSTARSQSIPSSGNAVVHVMTPPPGGGFATFVVSTRDAGASGTYTLETLGPRAGQLKWSF